MAMTFTGTERGRVVRRAVGAAFIGALMAPLLVSSCRSGPQVGAAEAEGRALRYAEAIGGRDTAVLHRLVTEDYVLHAGPLPGGELRGRDPFLSGVASDTTAWPPGRVVVTRIISHGDQVAVFGFFVVGANPLHPGSEGVPATDRVPLAAVHRLRGDRIAETWAVWDTRALERERARGAAAEERSR